MLTRMLTLVLISITLCSRDHSGKIPKAGILPVRSRTLTLNLNRENIIMATKAATKKATKKATKPSIKKAEVVTTEAPAATAVAAPDLKVVVGPVTFNVKQAKNIEMIGKNQDRIMKAAVNILDIAVDTGARLLVLKDVIKAQNHGWKEWVQEGNLPFSYEQANRYSKLAANPAELEKVKAQGVTSIEEAVKQIEWIKKPEKQEAAEKKAAAKAAAPTATVTAIRYTINAAFDVLQTFDISDLRQIQDFITDRIEELTQAEVDGEGDDGENTDTDDAADAADAAEHVGEVDPVS